MEKEKKTTQYRIRTSDRAYGCMLRANKSEFRFQSAAACPYDTETVLYAVCRYIRHCPELRDPLTGEVVSERRVYYPRVDVTVRSTVGAGDAMIAGLVAGFSRDLPLEEIFRLGVACATASVMSEGTGLIEEKTVQAILPRVNIKAIC